jgi:alpha,alpha-trehalase
MEQVSDMYERKAGGQTEIYVQLQGQLFEAVQRNGVFDDSKTFVDCVPADEPQTILDRFEEEREREDFDLRAFVEQNFSLPDEIEPAAHEPSDAGMVEHIQQLWEHLSRPAHEDVSPLSTLIPLIHPYVVPGGRFREIYYWDSYFEAEGLAACGRMDMVEDMVRNLAYLIERFGFVPNGNRLYYLSRSQPPVFTHMLEILERYKDTDAAVQYLDHLEQAYRFWMDGREMVDAEDNTHRRAVYIANGTVMNRYWDDRAEPRPEAYDEDIAVAQHVNPDDRAALFRNIRAACESGWDFSSRWFAGDRLQTIETTRLFPVDLNALLYNIEKQLADWFAYIDDTTKAEQYRTAATQRADVFDTFFWDDENGFYFDYHWEDERQTDSWTLAAATPLFVSLASQDQADRVAHHIEETFLEDGGLVATQTQSGEQWDIPNGWAPLHWITINGLLNYGHDTLAQEIAHRWLRLNRDVFARTGKMMEKYNVVDTSLKAGGGEYTLQDGFGWTNGVAIALLKNRFAAAADTDIRLTRSEQQTT